MAHSNSFKEYVSNAFDSKFWEATEKYIHDNGDVVCSDLCRIHHAGEPEIQEVNVEHVWTDSLSGLEVQFDVALSVNIVIPEADYHYDDYEDKTFWLMVRCRGSLQDSLGILKFLMLMSIMVRIAPRIRWMIRSCHMSHMNGLKKMQMSF